jgi:hypothetical protein
MIVFNIAKMHGSKHTMSLAIYQILMFNKTLKWHLKCRLDSYKFGWKIYVSNLWISAGHVDRKIYSINSKNQKFKNSSIL